MDRFDIIVIGAGAGTHIVHKAVESGMRAALIEQDQPGGTCLNYGCIPSKMLIYPADVIRTIQEAGAVGVHARIDKIDLQAIMNRMRSYVVSGRERLRHSIESEKMVTWYKDPAQFIDQYTLKSGDKILTAPKIVIASGARALIPPVPGLKEAGYLDNVSVLNITEVPKSLIIIGAGYIGCEYGHFFSAFGTEVTILGRSLQVLNDEDPEVCRIVEQVLSRDLSLFKGFEAVRVEMKSGKKTVSARNLLDNKISEFQADEIFVAAGRRANSDILRPEKTGISMDKRGWIIVDEHLQTTKQGIWAFGDCIGKHMFRHTANYESGIVWNNIIEEKKLKVDFHAVPHAVYTHPQVAGVGLKEAEAVAFGYKVLIGRARYSEVAKGYAMADEDGFVKAVIEEETGKILGCSCVGTAAPELIQQVVCLMNADNQDLLPLVRSQVIHPTISEVLVKAFRNLEHP
jgi:mycothione reductase